MGYLTYLILCKGISTSKVVKMHSQVAIKLEKFTFTKQEDKRKELVRCTTLI